MSQNKRHGSSNLNTTSVTVSSTNNPASSPPASSQQQQPQTVSPPAIEESFQPQYRHDMRPVPPYALEKLARCYYNKDRKETEGTDPFLQTIGNNWNDFLKTVEANPAYANGLVEYGKYSSVGAGNGSLHSSDDTISWNDIQADLNGKWGGDDRLRQTFNTDTPDISPYDNYHNKNEKSGDNWKGFWKNNKEKDTLGPQHRTKAGYWMSTEKRDDLKTTIKRILLNNPYIPLFFRIFELILSAVALGLAGRIFVLSNREYNNSSVGQQPSTIMAICVQSIAIVYLLFIARDEFGGRPLGLRDPLLKLRLILLDLLFIIFSSANLSLAFNTLYDDRWVCVNPSNSEGRGVLVGPICHRQRGLAAFLFVMLCMWVVTFTISILRVVEKVSSPVLSVHR